MRGGSIAALKGVTSGLGHTTRRKGTLQTISFCFRRPLRRSEMDFKAELLESANHRWNGRSGLCKCRLCSKDLPVELSWWAKLWQSVVSSSKQDHAAPASSPEPGPEPAAAAGESAPAAAEAGTDACAVDPGDMPEWWKAIIRSVCLPRAMELLLCSTLIAGFYDIESGWYFTGPLYVLCAMSAACGAMFFASCIRQLMLRYNRHSISEWLRENRYTPCMLLLPGWIIAIPVSIRVWVDVKIVNDDKYPTVDICPWPNASACGEMHDEMFLGRYNDPTARGHAACATMLATAILELILFCPFYVVGLRGSGLLPHPKWWQQHFLNSDGNVLDDCPCEYCKRKGTQSTTKGLDEYLYLFGAMGFIWFVFSALFWGVVSLGPANVCLSENLSWYKSFQYISVALGICWWACTALPRTWRLFLEYPDHVVKSPLASQPWVFVSSPEVGPANDGGCPKVMDHINVLCTEYPEYFSQGFDWATSGNSYPNDKAPDLWGLDGDWINGQWRAGRWVVPLAEGGSGPCVPGGKWDEGARFEPGKYNGGTEEFDGEFDTKDMRPGPIAESCRVWGGTWGKYNICPTCGGENPTDGPTDFVGRLLTSANIDYTYTARKCNNPDCGNTRRDNIITEMTDDMIRTEWFNSFTGKVQGALQAACQQSPTHKCTAVCVHGGPVSRVELSKMPDIIKNVHVRGQDGADIINALRDIEIVEFDTVENMLKEADKLLRYL